MKKQKMLPYLKSELESDESGGCAILGGWLSRTDYGFLRIGTDEEGPEDALEFRIEPGLKKALIDSLNHLLTDEE